MGRRASFVARSITRMQRAQRKQRKAPASNAAKGSGSKDES